jgi:hypothetical protein
MLSLQEPFPLSGGERVYPTVIVCGKVGRTPLELQRNKQFDVDVAQYGAEDHQSIRLRCQYPGSHPRFQKIPLPMPAKHVFVQGILTAFTEGRCMILVKDISFGQAEMPVVPSAGDLQPSTDIKHFDWEGKRMGKRARQHVEDEGQEGRASTSGAAA